MVQSVVAEVLFCAATGVLASNRPAVGGIPLFSMRFKPWCRFEAMQKVLRWQVHHKYRISYTRSRSVFEAFLNLETFSYA
jgi:hypothetical protein